MCAHDFKQRTQLVFAFMVSRHRCERQRSNPLNNEQETWIASPRSLLTAMRAVDKKAVFLIPPPAKRWGGWRIVSAAKRCVGWGLIPRTRYSRMAMRCRPPPDWPSASHPPHKCGRDKKERASLVSTPPVRGRRGENPTRLALGRYCERQRSNRLNNEQETWIAAPRSLLSMTAHT